MELAFEKQGAVAVLSLDHPPVNALNQAMRRALMESLSIALADGEVEVLVVIGRGRLFSAGADVREFGDATRPPPRLLEVVVAFQASPKPIVAAIHGAAFGGALELAMACHYRASASDAKLGLSEVKFGIIPGAGGTQLLPRLIGPAKALDMITSGEAIDAQEAATLGLVDRVIEGDLLTGALTFAREVAHQRPLPRASERTDRLSSAPGMFDEAEARVGRRARGAQAPLLALEAVKASVVLPFGAGLERERELWAQAATSPESTAMRYVFGAERAAAKITKIADIADLPAQPAAAGIRRAAVIGTGTMGRGIAIALANAGVDVTLIGRTVERLEAALIAIDRHYGTAVEKRKLSAAEGEARRARIVATTSWERLSEVDLALETVAEDLDLKREIFRSLDARCGLDTILATNTSSLNVDVIASATRRPTRVLGLHFFSPAPAVKLLEIVRGGETAPAAIAAGVDLARRLGKFSVVVRAGEGLASTRMFERYQREANRLLLEGALPSEVDAAMVHFGMALGPLATMDLAGLDVGRRVRHGEQLRRSGPDESDAIPERLAALGRFGQKSERGYYRYEAGERTPHSDPEVQAIIVDASRRSGRPRRIVDGAEIAERCVLAMVNEGANILDEGLALRASDIDTIWVDGYGFPRHRGGPMYHADLIGLAPLCERLQELERQHGSHWRPAPLLARLAREGASLATGQARSST